MPFENKIIKGGNAGKRYLKSKTGTSIGSLIPYPYNLVLIKKNNKNIPVHNNSINEGFSRFNLIFFSRYSEETTMIKIKNALNKNNNFLQELQENKIFLLMEKMLFHTITVFL